MKLTIESTSKIVELQPQGGAGAIPARIWEGETANGVKVHVYVTRIAVSLAADQSEFERELQAVGQPRRPSPDVDLLPLRLII